MQMQKIHVHVHVHALKTVHWENFALVFFSPSSMRANLKLG